MVLVQLLFLTFFSTACLHQSLKPNFNESKTFAEKFLLDLTWAQQLMATFTDSPHPMGSLRQLWLAEVIKSELMSQGYHNAYLQNFIAQTPNPKAESAAMQPQNLLFAKTGNNIIATYSQENSECVILVGSHYDTKDIAEFNYVGANDSASSSITLLAMAAFIKKSQITTICSWVFVWFDGEESILPNWHDGILSHPAKTIDHTYGSRYLASQLTKCQTDKLCLTATNQAVLAVIILDMIGSPNLKISRDQSSSPKLLAMLEKAAIHLNMSHLLGKRQSVADDHNSFTEKNIHGLDIIDFENLTTWHQQNDNAATIDYKSMEQAGKLALFIMHFYAQNPQEL